MQPQVIENQTFAQTHHYQSIKSEEKQEAAQSLAQTRSKKNKKARQRKNQKKLDYAQCSNLVVPTAECSTESVNKEALDPLFEEEPKEQAVKKYVCNTCSVVNKPFETKAAFVKHLKSVEHKGSVRKTDDKPKATNKKVVIAAKAQSVAKCQIFGAEELVGFQL